MTFDILTRERTHGVTTLPLHFGNMPPKKFDHLLFGKSATGHLDRHFFQFVVTGAKFKTVYQQEHFRGSHSHSFIPINERMVRAQVEVVCGSFLSHISVEKTTGDSVGAE